MKKGKLKMQLIWYQRRDGLWNAECACGAALCGAQEPMQKEFEEWHFARADEYRQAGQKELPCGPKEKAPDPNDDNPAYLAVLDALYQKTQAQYDDTMKILLDEQKRLREELKK